MDTDRAARRHDSDRAPDNRSDGQRDRDRILYTTALRRLDGVTQVASAGEAHVFHNRLTHTLEVAQIARRLAEHLAAAQPAEAKSLDLDCDVAEAAALGHDLGHPPFGHIGEEQLDDCVIASGNADGFEGNAQSLRIVTKLSIRNDEFEGLNLTRATLSGLLKYPWLRASAGKRRRKFGAYQSEQGEFDWARVGAVSDSRSLEAELMDWADDIAYSVHDLYDFVRAHLIPMDRLSSSEGAFRALAEELMAYWTTKDGAPEVTLDRLMAVWRSIIVLFPLDQAFVGSREHRAKLRSYTSFLINRYVRGDAGTEPPISLTPGAESSVAIQPGARAEVDLLKELTAHYVIRNRALATIQHGQRRVIKELFQALFDDAGSGEPVLLPIGSRESLRDEERRVRESSNLSAVRARIVADVISGMTEAQVLRLHGRLTGHLPGSLLEPLL